jgi:hypothetical protein
MFSAHGKLLPPLLPNCDQVLRPLTDLLKGGAKTLEWKLLHRRLSKMQNASWRRRCHSDTLPPMLNFPLPLTPPILISEGSCNKNLEDHWQPLGFFSHKLTDKESRYSTFDHELLAAQAAINHFCHFFEGHVFQLWNDHKPPCYCSSHVSVPISPRQQHHQAFISEFNVQLLYTQV